MPESPETFGMTDVCQCPMPQRGDAYQGARGQEKQQQAAQGPKKESDPQGGQGASNPQTGFSTGGLGTAAVFHSSQGSGAWVAVLQHQGPIGTFATMAAAMAAVYAAVAAGQ
jgi:hypothetical protein